MSVNSFFLFHPFLSTRSSLVQNCLVASVSKEAFYFQNASSALWLSRQLKKRATFFSKKEFYSIFLSFFLSGLIKSLCCLRPKSYGVEFYSFKDDASPSIIEINKLKGISNTVVRNEITHANFLRTITTTLPQRHSMTIIRSYLYDLFIEQVEKLSLTVYDNKRYWTCLQQSVPYGYYTQPHILCTPPSPKFDDDDDDYDN